MMSGLRWCVVLSAAGVAALAWYQFFSRTGGVDDAGVYRVSSLFDWANTLAFYLITPLGLSAYSLISARNVWSRLAYALILTVLTGALFFTFGRGGWLAGAVAVLAPVILLASRRIVVPIIIGIASVPILMTAVLGLDLSARLGDVLNIEGRQVIRDVVFNRALESPIFGDGFSSATLYVASSSDPLVALGFHNLYLVLLFDYGVVGLFMFLATWLAFAWECLAGLQWNRLQQHGEMITALAILIGISIVEFTGNTSLDFSASLELWIVLAWASAANDLRGSGQQNVAVGAASD
jgi:O-antigen ligase